MLTRELLHDLFRAMIVIPNQLPTAISSGAIERSTCSLQLVGLSHCIYPRNKRASSKRLFVDKRKIVGKRGEAIAASYLEERGYQILEQNWRCGRAEIDIIAKEGETLVFIEVKARQTSRYGQPARFFKTQQRDRIASAAGSYMEKTGHDWALRFDLISVVFSVDAAAPQIEHIPDAFFPGLF